MTGPRASAPIGRAPAGVLAMLAGVLALAAPAPAPAQSFRQFNGDECIVKTNAPPSVGRAVVTRIDNYCRHIESFLEPLDLRAKNRNKVVARIFAEYGDYAETYQRMHGGGPAPTAFFSPDLNAIVLFDDEQDVTLRQTLFHETSHFVLHRYIYEAPPWFREGLAEYFEGWRLAADGSEVEVRPNLYDLIIVQNALEEGDTLRPRDLVSLSTDEFLSFRFDHPEHHGYLHYGVAWSLVWFGLHLGTDEDRRLLEDYVRDLNREGARARLEVDDWDDFEARWREAVLALEPERRRISDHLLVGEGHRSNADWQEAGWEYEAVLSLDPTHAGALYWLGYCYKRRGRYATAVSLLRDAAELAPSDARPHYQLARIALGIDRIGVRADPETAEEHARAAVERSGGSSPSYRLLLARAQAEGGRADEAVKTVRALLNDVDEDEVDVYKPWLERFRDLAREQRRDR